VDAAPRAAVHHHHIFNGLRLRTAIGGPLTAAHRAFEGQLDGQGKKGSA